MACRWGQRAGHYLVLGIVAAALYFPNLGAPSLWDIDEAHNSEAAREMLDSGDWIVPTFNYQLRVDKPALLYWLQLAAYRCFGINEFAARLPSALAALFTVLCVYELGGALFGVTAGLLSGLILASAGMFCASAHFANPDALLDAFTVLTMLLFWCGYARGGSLPFVALGVSMGLAVLAKGPVGLLLPGAAISLFLVGGRQLRLLLTWRVLLGWVAFGLVALPWYVWVGVDTKTDFLRGFLLTHNVGRYLHPMESHSGPFYYYVIVLALGFAPWSVFLAPSAWFAVQNLHRRPSGEDMSDAPRPREARPAVSFLCCWIAVYLVFFSLAKTKLPNYILPIYPPVALLTAVFLARWRDEDRVPGWWMHASLACLVLLGVGTCLGLLAAGGALGIPALQSRALPGLERWAFLGLLPVLGAAGGWWFLARRQRARFLGHLVATSVLFSALLAAWGSSALERYKAPRSLVQSFWADQEGRDVRVGCYGYYQPSLVFYCRREVYRLEDENATREFLNFPIPVYLFLPATVWEDLRTRVAEPCRVVARNRDLYRGCEVVVVTNH